MQGTILYDPNGHIGLVAKVTDSGKIYLIDAHPDNSITYISYGEKFSRSSVNIGAGFLKFRPYQCQYVPTPNQQLDDYSLEQYYGSNLDSSVSWKNASYVFDGQQLPFVQYVRANLSQNGLTIKPVEETHVMLADLCRDFEDRVTSFESLLGD